MGDPKFSRRKYETPAQPWEGERIKAENELIQKYGLKNKRELWTAQSMVRRLRAQSRELQARLRTGDPQADKETGELLKRCARMALLPKEGATLNDVLALNTEAILDRRLQTVVYRKGLSYTPRQARQMIVHGHASIEGRKVTIPGYLVKRGEEEQIEYYVSSPMTNDMHPARPKPEDLERHKLAEQAREERAAAAKAATSRRGPPRALPKKVKAIVKVDKEKEEDVPEAEPPKDDDEGKE
ncbi:MAG: 30S ribosomal protein S4 [Thermoplasmata archaeon]|nr:30S ribosomal protein S4 [Thermoplasmata archaeon]